MNSDALTIAMQLCNGIQNQPENNTIDKLAVTLSEKAEREATRLFRLSYFLEYDNIKDNNFVIQELHY